MYIWVILKSLKNNYQAKKSFIVLWPLEKLVTKYMNMYLIFGINLKWTQWKIITTFIQNVASFCELMCLKNVEIIA